MVICFFSSFWLSIYNVVKKVRKKYGSISTPEIDWGEDIEMEDFD